MADIYEKMLDPVENVPYFYRESKWFGEANNECSLKKKYFPTIFKPLATNDDLIVGTGY